MDYTCPMHPEVRQHEPGACPKCGMALELRTAVSEEEDESPELRDMTRRFWLAAGFTVPLVLPVMGDMLPGHPLASLISM